MKRVGGGHVVLLLQHAVGFMTSQHGQCTFPIPRMHTHAADPSVCASPSRSSPPRRQRRRLVWGIAHHAEQKPSGNMCLLSSGHARLVQWQAEVK
eukprot:1421999-Alexandrium_andersonii.AAC.1